MGQHCGGGESDGDSDETVVGCSVTESDVEEEDFRRKRLPFLNDTALTTEVRISEGAPSPELCFTHNFCDHAYREKEKQIPQEASTSDQSQSLLQGWINCPSLTENISKPVFSLNAAAEGQQNNAAAEGQQNNAAAEGQQNNVVDIKRNGFQKDAEEKISQKLSNEDLFPEVSLCLDAPRQNITTVLKEQTPQDTFPCVLEDCQRTCMTITDADNRVKEHCPKNDTELSLTSTEKVFVEAFAEWNIETGGFEISDLLGSISDSECLKMINPLLDELECQGHAFSVDPSADDSSNALPVQLVTALNSLSGPVVQPASPVLPFERQLNIEGEQLNSEPSIQQLDDDCTQITNTIKSQLSTVQMEEIRALTGSNLERTTNEQPVGDQQREKEIISVYCGATCGEKQTDEGSSHPVEAAACAETAQTTSSRAIQLRETSSGKCRDHVSSHCQILQETQQRMSHSSEAKDFDEIQKSTSKDKQDLETKKFQEITLNEDRKENKHRRSKRIKNKLRKEAFGRNYVNSRCTISLSTINRRNMYGETLLHRAVAYQDIHLTRNIIKVCGNVNMRDYAGWTALHTASVEGFYEIANDLLKAGADVNARGKEQITPLQDAVKEGHYEMAELLLWYGADPLLKNEMGRCALEETSDPAMRKLLESYVAKSRRDSVSDEGVCARVTGTESTAKNGEEGNTKTTVLSWSTETEVQTKRVRLGSETTSQRADSCSSRSKTKLSDHQSPFSQASKQQTSKKSGETKQQTSKKSDFQQSRERTPNFKKKIKSDSTVLQEEEQSSLSTRKEAVVLHGTCNARVRRNMKQKKNGKGETQLHIAAKRGDLSLVKTLISFGICVNEQDNAGWTAIHEASNRGFTEVILELLKAGANVNSRSQDGVLPIHDAVSGNYLEAARILLQHGANPCEKNASGESALDVACDDEMIELLKSYSAADSVFPVETVEVPERRDCSRSRRSKYHCSNYCKNDGAALEPQHEKYSVESAAAIRDAGEKQKEMFLIELRTSNDADLYIQRLCQIQDTLNEMLAKQKTERDNLAKKYKASVESFEKGALRKQLVNLASRQKSLLTVAQNQEELVQKIQNYRRTKQVFSASCPEKQTSNFVISHQNDKRQSLTADEIVRPDVVASTPKGNRVEAHLSLENRFAAQECSQHPHICLDETGANKDAFRRKEDSDHALASKNRVREYPFNMSKLTNALEIMALPSEPTVSTAKTQCAQQKDIDCVACVAITEQENKSLKPTSGANTLNIVEPRSTVVNNSICQPGSDCQQVLTYEELHGYVNKEEAFQQQQVILLTSSKNLHNNLQQMSYRSKENSFSANSLLTNLTSNTNYLVNLSEKSSQSCSRQEYEQNQVRYSRKNKKKLQLIDLLELGRIKPGENVLEYKVQEFSHKATLLKNGRIRTSKRRIMQNPVQWVKDLLGSDIYVSWKYVWNKVTYLGTQLSKFVAEEVSLSSDLELAPQEREPLGKNFIARDPSHHNQHHQSPGTVSIAQPLGTFVLSNMQPKIPSLLQTEVGRTLLSTEREAAVTREFKSSSVLFNSVESMTHFFQFREIVMVPKEEFLPCPAMEKHWSFYKGCEDFGF